MKRTVTVLQDDIDNGEPRRAYRCAIARAARRDLADLLPEHGHACFDGSFLILKNEFYVELAEARAPREARDFISSYDNELPVEPFKFEIEIPE